MLEGLTYNTAQEDLVIPAYGRYVQEMIHRAADLEGERQQALVERIVKMMAQQYDDQTITREDLTRRLWKHVYRLSNYRLTAVPPEGDRPTPEEDAIPPEEVPYPKPVPKQRNYGEYVQKMIDTALAAEDPERKRAIVTTVASYMKLAYSTYNDAQNISDKTILADLNRMSEGQLEVPEGASLDAFMGKGSQSHIVQVAPTTRRRSKKKSGYSKSGGNNQGGGGRSRKRFRRR